MFFAHNISPVHNGYSFVVKSIKAEFKKSAVLGDILEVKTDIKTLKKASVVMVQRVFRDDVELFSAEVEAVCLYEGKVSKMPQLYSDILINL